MKTKIGFAVGMMFSVGVLAQSVQDAWNNTPQSCDTGCAMNSVATVTGSQSGNGSWVTLWSGKTSGSVSYPAGYSLISVTYYVDWTYPTLTYSTGDSLDDRYETVLIKSGDSTVRRLNASINACSQSTFNLTVDYGASGMAAYGDSAFQQPNNCSASSVTVYVTKIEAFK
jgi:hypothetical protein